MERMVSLNKSTKLIYDYELCSVKPKEGQANGIFTIGSNLLRLLLEVNLNIAFNIAFCYLCFACII